MDKQIEIEGGINLRVFEVVRRLKQEVDDLYEELEVLTNKRLVEGVERSRREAGGRIIRLSRRHF